jgi:hypothetical protein
MKNRNGFTLLAAALSLFLGVTQSPDSFASDNSLNPEELVARHLKSIGSPQVLAMIKSRAVKGVGSVKFMQGGVGNLTDGKSLIVSEGHKLGVIMYFGALNYPGEHLAFDGKDVTISYIDFNLRSPLGSFVNVFQGLLKEGLWGGTLSTAWPLLDMKGRRPTLKYRKRNVAGREMHELAYSPKSRSGMNDVRIELFFDLLTFRHIRTEYKYPYAVSSLQVIETFDDFRAVDGMILPHKYDIAYSPVRPMPEAFMSSWTIEAKEFLHNGAIDPQLFTAQSLSQWRSK